MPRDPKNNYPDPGQDSPIGPLTKEELKSPVKAIGIGDKPYASRQGGTVTFTATGPKMGRGKVPNDVLARYRKAVNQAKANNLPPPYLNYNGEDYYYQSRGKSLTRLSGKLEVVANKTATELAQTPKLEDYIAVFGEELGQQQFDAEQARMAKINKNTGKGFSRGHIRPNAQGGAWHSRNLRLEDLETNAQNRVQTNPPGVEEALLLHGGTNQEHISLQGPQPTPKARQSMLRGESIEPPKLQIKGGVGRLLMGAGGALTALGVISDAGEAKAGVEQIVESESITDRLAGGMRVASGLTGLASVGAPVLALPSLLFRQGAALLQYDTREAAQPESIVPELFPRPQSVMANTPSGVATLTEKKPRVPQLPNLR